VLPGKLEDVDDPGWGDDRSQMTTVRWLLLNGHSTYAPGLAALDRERKNALTVSSHTLW
jgi:hypothetical protein